MSVVAVVVVASLRQCERERERLYLQQLAFEIPRALPLSHRLCLKVARERDQSVSISLASERAL